MSRRQKERYEKEIRLSIDNKDKIEKKEKKIDMKEDYREWDEKYDEYGNVTQMWYDWIKQDDIDYKYDKDRIRNDLNRIDRMLNYYYNKRFEDPTTRYVREDDLKIIQEIKKKLERVEMKGQEKAALGKWYFNGLQEAIYQHERELLVDGGPEPESYDKIVDEMADQYEDISREAEMLDEIEKLEEKYSEKREVNPLEMLRDIQRVRVMLHEAEKMLLKCRVKDVEPFRENVIKPLMILRKRLQDRCENDIQWNMIYSWVGKK